MTTNTEKVKQAALVETKKSNFNLILLRLLLGRFRWVFEKSIAILLVLLVWEVVPRAGLVDPFLLPTFTDVLKGLVGLFKSGEMFKHLEASFLRSSIGFILAVGFAVPLGILLGWYKRLERIINPLLEIGRNTPILALYPVFIVFFGLGEVSKLAIIFSGTLWPILLNTIRGVKDVDPILIKAARSMGVSRLTLFRKVILPAATPVIFTGLRLGATSAILILVAAEMLNANAGLGFMIFYYEDKYLIPLMFAGVITLSFVGVLINYTLAKVEKGLTSWKQEIKH